MKALAPLNTGLNIALGNLSQNAQKGKSATSAAATKSPVASNAPADLQVDEDTRSPIDLSSIDLKNLGRGNTDVIIEISATAGILEASSTNKVQVIGSGTGTVQLVGRPSQLKDFLSDPNAIFYTGAQNDFGAGAAALSLSVVKNGTKSLAAGVSVDINEVPDDHFGTPLDDFLTGDNGRDRIYGLAGNDSLRGDGGDDTIAGDAGRDTIMGGAGADILDGGADEDLLLYFGSSAGVMIDLNADASGFQKASGGDAAGDVISNFENVYGSDHADTIIGDAGANALFGYAGDDSIVGGDGDDVIRGDAGADTLEGGNGTDWLRYVDSPLGVVIDLVADASGFQTASGGDAQGDVISGFENVQGSDFGDVINGDAGANYILGFDGDDIISGGAGRDTIRGGAGADTLDGGADVDTLQYIDSGAGVTIDLRADAAGFQTASGGDAAGDVISGFENVYASNFDDVLTGDVARNILYGYDGADILNGREGKDVLRGGADADQFVFDTALGASNVDRILDFEVNIDTIMLSSGIFAGLSAGALDPNAFRANSGGVADAASQRIVYDTDTGNLYYDSDGNGAAAPVLFATLSSLPILDDTDFFVF